MFSIPSQAPRNLRNWSAVGACSSGHVLTRTLDRTYSDAVFVSHGASHPNDALQLSKRHRKPGTKVTLPPFRSTRRSLNSSKTPCLTLITRWVLNAWADKAQYSGTVVEWRLQR